MSELYNAEYYHKGCGPIPYEEPAHWVKFFGDIADRIVKDFHPKTVLDAGCAMGYLVAALRDRGVLAYGVDISDYAISMVRDDIRPYCMVGSLTEPLPEKFPKQFDMVTNIEVLEHLYEEDGKKAIKNLCQLTDCILFSSTADDLTESTHVNVQQPEYWVKLFSRYGFYRHVGYDASYLSKAAMLFRKTRDMSRVVEDYERQCRLLKQTVPPESGPERAVGKAYFDLGKGISETDSLTFSVAPNGKIHQRIALPGGCKCVRLDPIEGQGCLIWDLHVRTESDILRLSQHNGVQAGDLFIFRTVDPQFIFEELPAGSRWVEIDASIGTVDQDAWIRLAKQVEELKAADARRAELEEVVEEKENGLNAQRVALEDAARQEAELRGIVEDKERHIQNQNRALEDAARQEAELRGIVEDKERHIQNQNQALEEAARQEAELRGIVEDKERHIQNQNQALEEAARQEAELRGIVEDKERHIQNQNQALEEAEKQCAGLREAAESKEQHIEKQNAELEILKHQEAELWEIVEENEKSLHEREEKLKAASLLAAQSEEIIREQKEQIDRQMLQIAQIERQKQDDEARFQAEYGSLLAQKGTADQLYFSMVDERDTWKQQALQVQAAYEAVANAACWKMTAPLRGMLDAVKRLLKSNKYTYLFCRGLKCLKENGIRYTYRNIQGKLNYTVVPVVLSPFPSYTAEELDAQRGAEFPRSVKFSIVVPLYNTPQNFLLEMMQSLIDQTYGNWELCMADGSDKDHAYVGRICKAYAKLDKRFRYKRLRKNKGISGNTNACLAMAEGDYIGLLDHDDLLHPAALYEVMKAICEKDADFIYTDENTFHVVPEDAYCPHFKPDFAPDTLRSYNYICHFSVFSKKLLKEAGGGFRSRFDGSQDYDLTLRLTEKAKCIRHIPKILYYWRSHEQSVASDVAAKPYALTAAKLALKEHLQRLGLAGEVQDSRVPSTYHIQYEIKGNPLVSIMIPNKDHIEDLKKCIQSILLKTTYSNWEIIIIENNSTEAETFAYYEELEKHKSIHVVRWEGKFNYSAINNFGVQYAHGEHILLLNNDVEVITPDWIEQMLMFSQREDVGAVGAMLYYPDDTVQHAGVIIGLGGVAGHSHKYFPRGHVGYMYRLTLAQNLSAVTAACMLVRREVWEKVGGIDESFEVAFNDVDFCMRIREAGYLIVWTPYAEMYHHESKSRGFEDTYEKQRRFEGEILRFKARWKKELAEGDPYYNPNFTLDREDFSIKQ